MSRSASDLTHGDSPPQAPSHDQDRSHDHPSHDDAHPSFASQTRIAKRSLSIAGHRTSISLEDIFWQALKRLAEQRGVSLAALVGDVDAARDGANLSSALRVFVFKAVTELERSHPLEPTD